MLCLRAAGSLVVSAVMLTAPIAQAECAKATAMRPCPHAGSVTHSLPQRLRPTGLQPRPRSVGLIMGGVGVVIVGLVALAVAGYMTQPCLHEHGHEPCPEAVPYIYGGLATGALGVLGGSVMIYYGALDAPVQPTRPVTFLPPMPPAPRCVAIRFRF
jgi:hypothetical protein